MLPPLIELSAFDAAARHLSFKLAAVELGVTPTAISHQIRLLERYCGCRLFRRRPRPLSLTQEGARLFPAIRNGLEVFATAIASVKQDADRQPLRVTTTNAFASRWLVPHLPHWRKLRPDITLDVIGTDSVLDLQSWDADVAIRYAREAPVDGIARELIGDTFYAFRSPKLQPSGLKQAADLRGRVLVHCYWAPSDAGAPTWRRWLEEARKQWHDVPDAKEMGHLSFREELHAIESVIAGQGIGIFSTVVVASELAAGTLVRAFDLSLPGYRFYVVHRSDHPREKIIQAFSTWLHSTIKLHANE